MSEACACRKVVLLQTVTGDFVDDDIYYDLLDPADIDMVCKPVSDAVYVVPMGHRTDRHRDSRHLRQVRQPDRTVAAQRAEESPAAVHRQGLEADRRAGKWSST